MVEGKRFKKVHLEVGAGRRYYLLREALEKPETLFLSLDYSKHDSMTSRRMSKHAGNVAVLTASSLQIPVANESVDSARAVYMFSRLSKSPGEYYGDVPLSEAKKNAKEVLDEVHRVLKEGGKFEVLITNERLAKAAKEVMLEDDRFDLETNVMKAKELFTEYKARDFNPEKIISNVGRLILTKKPV